MVEVKIEGMEALVKRLNSLAATGPQIRNVVKKNGAKLSNQTQSNMLSAYTGHYEGNKFVKPTGATRRSAGVEISDGGMTATVAPSTKYFPYLEYGTRFMDARPTLQPAFKMVGQMFVKDMKDLFND